MATSSFTARGFYIGLAIGQIWLALIGTGFASLLWVVGQNAVQISLILIGVVLIGLALLGASVVLLRSARHLSEEATPENVALSRATGKKMGLRFGLVFLVEGLVIGASNIILSVTNHNDWSVPVTYFIVGLHFIPLAFVFRVRPYIFLGVFWVLIVLLTITLTPGSMIIGQGLNAWVFFPIAGCGLASWVVVAFILGTNIMRVRHALRLSVLA